MWYKKEVIGLEKMGLVTLPSAKDRNWIGSYFGFYNYSIKKKKKKQSMGKKIE